MIPTTYPFKVPVPSMQKKAESWKTTVNSQKLNQVITLTSAFRLGEVSLLKQTKTTPGT